MVMEYTQNLYFEVKYMLVYNLCKTCFSQMPIHIHEDIKYSKYCSHLNFNTDIKLVGFHISLLLQHEGISAVIERRAIARARLHTRLNHSRRAFHRTPQI